jgi:hypothetical protein
MIPVKQEGYRVGAKVPYPNLSKLKNKFTLFAPIADSINKELRRRFNELSIVKN